MPPMPPVVAAWAHVPEEAPDPPKDSQDPLQSEPLGEPPRKPPSQPERRGAEVVMQLGALRDWLQESRDRLIARLIDCLIA